MKIEGGLTKFERQNSRVGVVNGGALLALAMLVAICGCTQVKTSVIDHADRAPLGNAVEVAVYLSPDAPADLFDNPKVAGILCDTVPGRPIAKLDVWRTNLAPWSRCVERMSWFARVDGAPSRAMSADRRSGSIVTSRSRNGGIG